MYPSTFAVAALPWAPILLWLGKAAVSYVGGVALERSGIFAQRNTGPTLSDVVGLIESSVESLKQYFSEDVRRAFSEDRVKDLEARCESLRRDLGRYTSLMQQHRSDYRHLLVNSDTQTSAGISLSKQYSPIALPAFAVLVNLRIVVMRAFYEHDKNVRAYQNFIPELREYQRFIIAELNKYVATLDPNVRLGPLDCELQEGRGPGFHTRSFNCLFPVDGQYLPNNGYGSSAHNGDQEDRIRGLAANVRHRKEVELAAYRDKVVLEFVDPLKQNAQMWGEVVTLIAANGRRIPTAEELFK
ncbi:hypothetical protein AYO42_00805 [Rhizomicrobium sp. SCGC AG-212-E05]|nr:hypothetical protein AYO42_00805 [Rhizomicrobium sp. SCGC AG-212-E05]